ncbi:hypothetical protein ACFE04_022418 [Oxalis oulophora]
MKQKIVMQVQMHCEKCRSKAMKIAAVSSGVANVGIQGEDKLVIIGEGVDPVEIAFKLRKKLRHATILSVAEEKESSQEINPEEAPTTTPTMVPWTWRQSYDPYPQHNILVCEPAAGCSIM